MSDPTHAPHHRPAPPARATKLALLSCDARVLASIIGNFVKASIALVFWILIGSAAAAVLYVGLRAIGMAVQTLLQALGA